MNNTTSEKFRRTGETDKDINKCIPMPRALAGQGGKDHRSWGD